MSISLERRTVAFTDVEIRDASEGRPSHFVGYASVFNTPYEVGSFRESVSSAAFNRALDANQDVRMLFNHDPNLVLGRSGANMTLNVDERGLRVEADLPSTTLGNDMAELIRSGIVNQMSFGFSVPEGGDEWRRGEDGVAERTLNDVNLFDVSPVVYPASSTTTAEVRARADEISDESEEAPEATDTVYMNSATTTSTGFTVVQNITTSMPEDRIGRVISDANMQKLKTAHSNISDVIACAGSPDDSEDAPMPMYNSSRRQRVLDLLDMGLDLRAPMRPGSIESGPDKGSYPITDATSLHDAIQAYGRAKDEAAVKAHIIAKAKQLGHMDMLPEEWMA